MAQMTLRHTTHRPNAKLHWEEDDPIPATTGHPVVNKEKWKPKIRNALWERLPQENQSADSMDGLVPPTMVEQREIRNGNAGKFLNHAG